MPSQLFAPSFQRSPFASSFRPGTRFGSSSEPSRKENGPDDGDTYTRQDNSESSLPDQEKKPKRRRGLAALAASVAAIVAAGAVAWGPMGLGRQYEVSRALEITSTADQEYKDSTIFIDGMEYHGGYDEKSGLGYLIVSPQELRQLTADSPTKRFKNNENVVRCGLEELGRFIGGHDRENIKTVDLIGTKGRTLSGKEIDVVIIVDNRNIEEANATDPNAPKEFSDLTIQVGATLPDDCTDIPGNVGEALGDAARGTGEFLEDLTNDAARTGAGLAPYIVPYIPDWMLPDPQPPAGPTQPAS